MSHNLHMQLMPQTSTRSRLQKQESGRLSTSFTTLLHFPPEILISIAQYVVQEEVRSDFKITIIPQAHYHALSPLSLSHSSLRKACIAAGMFSCIKPTLDISTRIFEETHRSFGRVIYRGFGLTPITSLIIDLSNPKVWDFCDAIMDKFPRLEELGFSGSLDEGIDFLATNIGKNCLNFGGKSLVLRNVNFTCRSLDVLLSLWKHNITWLTLERSDLLTVDHGRDQLYNIMFPNLRGIKFLGTYCTEKATKVMSQLYLLKFFLLRSKITYFEISYGGSPNPVQDESIKKEGVSPEAKKLYSSLQTEILHLLRVSSFASLKVYIERDDLSDPFTGEGSHNWWPCRRPFLFSNMGILIFRCEDLQSLFKVDEIAFVGKNCNTSGMVKYSHTHPQLWEEHSAWLYIRTLHAHFWPCNCVLIETRPGLKSIKPSWWDLASRKLFSLTRRNVYPDLLRYFIVGNIVDGYTGMESCPQLIQRDETGNAVYGYSYMNQKNCTDILIKKMYGCV